MVRYTQPESTDDPGYLDWVEAVVIFIGIGIPELETFARRGIEQVA